MTTPIPCMCQPKATLYPNKLHTVGEPCCEREVVDIRFIPEEHRQQRPGLINPDDGMLFKHPCGTYTRLKPTY